MLIVVLLSTNSFVNRFLHFTAKKNKNEHSYFHSVINVLHLEKVSPYFILVNTFKSGCLVTLGRVVFPLVVAFDPKRCNSTHQSLN